VNLEVEIPFKQWRVEQANRLGVKLSRFNSWLYRDKRVNYPKVRRVNHQIVFVIQK
jgi:hypothetical protein